MRTRKPKKEIGFVGGGDIYSVMHRDHVASARKSTLGTQVHGMTMTDTVTMTVTLMAYSS